ncbi:NIPSNAP family protein [Allopusillimonas ginsengisoli]|uniref:NIPSNAP family protein n=1 Tax=Allopusillimonas ginsengisoli TaxID=453575 RepID=UPI0010200578|nr:NIPSNAP family protein [Allopusillimonas ginsengisoli]TEA78995.1 NIPSNAP family protein [Allopusillimonas ginsengisoli]
MIVELRTYTIKPGGVPAYLDVYMREAMEVQKKHLPHMVGYFSTDIGPLNQIVHMWGYADLNERARCRDALYADPAWQVAVKKLLELIDVMETKILVPTIFSPIK